MHPGRAEKPQAFDCRPHLAAHGDYIYSCGDWAFVGVLAGKSKRSTATGCQQHDPFTDQGL